MCGAHSDVSFGSLNAGEVGGTNRSGEEHYEDLVHEFLSHCDGIARRRAATDAADAEGPNDDGLPDERPGGGDRRGGHAGRDRPDRKSTRLNSSHMSISYAVFCLKKKKYTTSIDVMGAVAE